MLKWKLKAFSGLFPGSQKLFSRTARNVKIRSKTVLFYQNLEFVNVFVLSICLNLRNTWLLFTVPYVNRDPNYPVYPYLGLKFVIKIATHGVLCIKNQKAFSGDKVDHSKVLELFEDVNITDKSHRVNRVLQVNLIV